MVFKDRFILQKKRQEKGDLLIQVTTWEGLTVYCLINSTFPILQHNKLCKESSNTVTVMSAIPPTSTNKQSPQLDCTVKTVYSGHLGEIDKMTTIYR